MDVPDEELAHRCISGLQSIYGYGNPVSNNCKRICHAPWSLIVRISDARYSRDLRRYQLAWRLIQHGARNRTVQRWSGLSMYRARTLYAAYAAGLAKPPRSALRGAAPHQISFFWRSAHLKCEAAVLGGFLYCFGALPAVAQGKTGGPLETLMRGEQLCRAYEAFRACCPEAQSTVEHAILLLMELHRGVEITFGHCMDCDILIVIDRLAITPPRCAYCAHEAQVGLPYTVSPRQQSESESKIQASEPLQQSLFEPSSVSETKT